MNVEIIINSLINKYNLTKEDINYIMSSIELVFNHKELKRRMTESFLHHDQTTLGYHLLEDTIVSYKIAKKKRLSDKETKLTLLIAIMHDLYVEPWQNNHFKYEKSFFYKHGFRHSIESVINAITWFPTLFKNDESAKIIIDGILHHMYPLPVTSINKYNYKEIELNNLELFEKLDNKYKEMIYESTKRYKIGKVSLCRSIYLPGKIVSRADKISSLDNFSSISGIIALVTGKNKHLK